MTTARTQLTRLLLCLLIAPTLWAGKIFTAGPGEQVVPNQLIVHYKPNGTFSLAALNAIPGVQFTALLAALRLYLLKVPNGAAAAIAAQLALDPMVDYIEPNRVRHTTLQVPNDPLMAANQWDLAIIQAQNAWQYLPNTFLTAATAGTGRIKIAVLDTGFDCTHPDFANIGGSSDDAASGGQVSFALSQVSADITSTHTPLACAWQDDFGHGTHVSGTIAAATNNGVGLASLGYPLELIEFKVLDHTGNGSDSDVGDAIKAAADAGASVVSMSLGGSGYSQTIQNAVTYAWQRNCLVVAAAGNDNSSELFFPADANYAIAVGATDSSDAIASFSNFGPNVDIAAPGVNITSTLPTYPNTVSSIQNYGNLSGTSMATPHVAALAGLVDLATPNLSPLAVAQRIQQSADSSIANGGRDDHFGYGRINAWRALAPGNLRTASVGGIVGQVIDNTGLPVASATVSVNGQTPVTDVTGLFHFSGFPSGVTYTITTSAATFANVTQKVAVLPGADTMISIVMGVTTGEFHGIVSDGAAILPGAVVQAISGGLVQSTAVTDSTGAYSLLVTPGTYDLRASMVSGITSTVSSMTVAANGSVAVNISMSRLGSIAGTVTGAAANTQINIANGSFTAGALTDGSGNYSTLGIPAGTYSVNAAISGSPTTINGIVVTNDHVSTVNFPLTGVTVTTSTPGLTISVDGVNYTSPQSFTWSVGTVHTLAIASMQNGAPGTRYVWANWSDSGAISHSITASASTTTYTANVNTQYLLTLTASPVAGGTLTANPTSSDGYYTSPASVQINATPNTNYQFAALSGDLTGASGQSVTMSAPRSVTGSFNPKFTVATNPAALTVTEDASTGPAPVSNFWILGTSHSVSTTSPQSGTPGTQYVWTSWSDSGAISHTISSAPGVPTTYTASFNTQYQLTTAVSPAGSGSVTPASGAFFTSGAAVPITATPNSGFVFAGWTGGAFGNAGSASTNVTLSAPTTVTANFAVQVTIASSPAGRTFSVTGAGCQPGASYTAPQALNWTPGSSCVVAFTTPQSGGAGTQYAFNSWPDNSSTNASRTFAVPAGPTTYTGNFDTQYQLTVNVAPAGAGSTTGAGFHAAGSTSITATANPGFSFLNWTGGTFGNPNSASTNVTSSAPTTITANFATQVTIASSPSGRTFSVTGAGCQAGASYTTPQPLNWTPGSSCVVAFSTPQSGAAGVQYAFNSWPDNASTNPSRTFAVPAVATTYTANFDTQYQLTTSVSPASSGTVTPASGGFYTSGTAVPITATPNSGFVFSNWTGGSFGNASSASTTVTMSAPTPITANFVGPVIVTIASTPVGRSFNVTGAGCQPGGPYTTPLSLSWTQGSSCVVTFPNPQSGGAGTQYALNHWVDNGSISTARTFTVPASATTYTAAFDTQYQLTVASSPANGGSLTPASPTFFTSGISTPITATANAGFVFSNWTGGTFGNANSASTTVTVTAPATITANFQPPVTVIVASSPSGRSFGVTGSGCQPGAAYTTPQPLTWTPGSSCVVTFGTPQAGAAGTQYSFNSWADNASTSPSRTFTVPASATTYTANFDTQVAVTIASAPTGRSFNVSGAGCQPGAYTTQQSLAWTQGASCVVSFPNPQAGAPGTQFAFNHWVDNGSSNPSRTFTVPASATTYTANFDTQYQLTTEVSPPSGGGITPASGAFYTSGTAVPVTASANSGFQFNSFTGDLTGSTNPQTVTMSAPRSVIANFSSLTGVTITTNPPGLSMTVDGILYTTAQTFNWVQGSNHTLAVTGLQTSLGTRYTWTGWSDAGAISHSVTAPAAGTTYTANFNITAYQLTLAASPAAGGNVTVSPTSSDGFYLAGTTVQVMATANPNYLFVNFLTPGSSTMNPLPVSLGSPRSITANFVPTSSITVATSPPGLSIIVDGAPSTAPRNFTWVQGSAHTIAIASLQAPPQGTQYVFLNWSDNGGASHIINVPGAATTYTANYATQYLLTTNAFPSAAGTVVATPASGDGYYPSGMSVQMSAIANAGFQFTSYSGDLTGSANPQSVVMSAPRTVAGNFTPFAGVTVNTIPAGLPVLVDGVAYTAPHGFTWTAGSSHSIAVSSPQTITGGTRYVWANWSDAGAISHNITVPNGSATYTANFNTQYLLTMAVSPAGDGSVSTSPSSPDGYYASGTSVQVTATANGGFVFSSFAGDLTGSTDPQSVVLTAPRTVTANYTTTTATASISVDRPSLYFGTANGIVTSPQTVRIITSPGVSWTASSNQPNITVSPAFGLGGGTIQITASPSATPPSGVVTVSAAGATGSPQQIQVSIANVTPGQPFGSFDKPDNNTSGIAGAIAVTGWALDNIEVTGVDIWREPVGGEATQSNGLVPIGNAVFIPDTRPDVEGTFPTAPLNYRAGWGYLLLTNFLPNTGNGTYKLHAIAHDKSGNLLDLGTRTITVDNAHASRPFGTIDTPDQGGVVSGTNFINFGWALTQNPFVIPIDGSTITVMVDSLPVGHPTYNQNRSDIATDFPGLANSNGAVGYFFIDTTKLSNGMHTISWLVYDNAGRGDGVGSRFFTVLNNGSATVAEPQEITESTSSVTARVGYDRRDKAQTLTRDSSGDYSVTLDELGHLELHTGAVRGHLLVARQHRPLPVGSTLRGGVFYWQPPPGFLGQYQLQFERSDGKLIHVRVTVGHKIVVRMDR